VVLLILVALLWIAVLAPGAITKISERRSSGSIDSFHNRLHLLERTGPTLIRPVHRLQRVEDPRLSTAVGYAQLVARPTLRLLETAEPQTDDAIDMVSLDDPEAPQLVIARHAARAGSDLDDDRATPGVRMLDGPSLGTIPRPEAYEAPEVVLVPPQPRSGSSERRAAARRRRDILGVLVTTTVLSGLLGVVPSLRPALVATGVCGFLLIVFIGLALYAVTTRTERPATDGLALATSGGERLREMEVSHVGPLHRLGDDAPDSSDDEPELRRVVRAG
jgi:hypothetical protein